MHQVLYGQVNATETSAGGVSGVLCKSTVGEQTSFFFRVASPEGEIQDYQLRHDDLKITIDQDELVSFYRLETGEQILDHASRVLGLDQLEKDDELLRKEPL